jgi:hypothetical protein
VGGAFRPTTERDLTTIIAWTTSNGIHLKLGYRPIGDASDHILNSRNGDTVR